MKNEFLTCSELLLLNFTEGVYFTRLAIKALAELAKSP
jgi:hypothetical protein